MKKLPALHILNGDASLDAFNDAAFPGQVLVWREILSEGPALSNLPEHEFWLKRQQYITATYQETPEVYKQKVLNELNKLSTAHAFFEVILWFDADLLCQVNLLYLLQKLYSVQPPVISVCTPADGKSIGYLSAAEMHHIFEARQVQTKEHLQQAKQLWQLYTGADPLQLQRYLQQHSLLHPYLKAALELHLQRFPDCDTGLSQPETILMQLIKNGAITVQHLMQQFWQQAPLYGFGDLQLLHMLSRLQPALVQPQEPLQLTALGESVINGIKPYTTDPQWIGGAYMQPENTWCYSKQKKLLIATDNLAPNVQ